MGVRLLDLVLAGLLLPPPHLTPPTQRGPAAWGREPLSAEYLHSGGGGGWSCLLELFPEPSPPSYGAPGVEFMGLHRENNAVVQIHFLPGQVSPPHALLSGFGANERTRDKLAFSQPQFMTRISAMIPWAAPVC